jgi:cell shape-determining protein MreC
MQGGQSGPRWGIVVPPSKQERFMQHLYVSIVAVALMVTARTGLCVQDPQISAAQLDARLTQIRHEIGKINAKFSGHSITAKERQQLQLKLNTLSRQERSLLLDKSNNAQFSQNPLVQYGGDFSFESAPDRVDGLFK